MTPTSQPRDEPAEQLADRLLGRFTATSKKLTSDAATPPNDEPPEVYLADIEAHLEAFALIYGAALRENTEILCAQRPDGVLVPVDILSQVRDLFNLRIGPPQPGPKKVSFNAHLYVEGDDGLKYTTVSPSGALASLRAQLIEFLRVRLAAPRALIGIAPGTSITVHTMHAGQRVEYAPCFFHSIRTILGAPTTPVTGWMHPGRYSFAASNGKARNWDAGQYDIPTLVVVHLSV